MNRLLYLSGIALIGLAALGMSSTVRAQALPVDIDITIEAGGIAILNYYESIDVTVSPADLASLQNVGFCTPTDGEASCKDGPSPLGDANLGPGGGGGDLNANGSLLLSTGTALKGVRLDIDNVWAVRAIGGINEATTVTFRPGAGTTLTNSASTSSTIAILGVQGYLMDVNNSIDDVVEFTDPGLQTPQYGGVQLLLDVSNATTAGVYSTTPLGETDANFTIEITGT
jgi:hypothetical protein